MQRRSFALDRATREHLQTLSALYGCSHSAVVRLAVSDLAARLNQLNHDPDTERKRIQTFLIRQDLHQTVNHKGTHDGRAGKATVQ